MVSVLCACCWLLGRCSCKWLVRLSHRLKIQGDIRLMEMMFNSWSSWHFSCKLSVCTIRVWDVGFTAWDFLRVYDRGSLE